MLRFRGAAVKHGRAQQFNDFLNELAAKYEGSDSHGSFWTALMAERVRPISAAECEGGVPEATASQFLKDHMETQKASSAVSVRVCYCDMHIVGFESQIWQADVSCSQNNAREIGSVCGSVCSR